MKFHNSGIRMYRRLSLPVRECGLKLNCTSALNGTIAVTPRAGVWIEILLSREIKTNSAVTPRAGVWIEIRLSSYFFRSRFWSLPVRECGLKYFYKWAMENGYSVTPRAGVWIEIARIDISRSLSIVTPRAGVWIEMKLSPT